MQNKNADQKELQNPRVARKLEIYVQSTLQFASKIHAKRKFTSTSKSTNKIYPKCKFMQHTQIHMPMHAKKAC